MPSAATATEGIVSVGTAKMIGFLLAICGNTLIACSLTLQKSAHNSLSETASSTTETERFPEDLTQLSRDEDVLANSVNPSSSVPTITNMSTSTNSNSAAMSSTTCSISKASNTTSIPEPLQEDDIHLIDPESQLKLPPSAASVDYDLFARVKQPLKHNHSHIDARTSSGTTSSSSSTNSSSSSSGIGTSSSVPTRSDSGLAFLRNPIWWMGTFLMAAGEIGNFAAFAFAPASLVAPLGAWSVVLSAILAHVFLHESVSNVNVIGIALCVTGAFLIGTSGPDVSAREASLDAAAVSRLLIRMPFVIFILLTVSATVGLIYVSHRTTLGQRYIFIYVGVSSLLGSVTVVCAKALSTFLRLTIEGNSQFGNWLPFALGITLGSAILAQLRYLNMAMSQFGNAQVIPVYYVLFTTCAMASGVIMYREFDELTVRNLPFFVGICSTMSGVFLVSKSARPEGRTGSSLSIENGHDSSCGYRSSSKKSRTTRYERVLPVSPMSSPRAGQLQMW